MFFLKLNDLLHCRTLTLGELPGPHDIRLHHVKKLKTPDLFEAIEVRLGSERAIRMMLTEIDNRSNWPAQWAVFISTLSLIVSGIALFKG